MSCYMGKEEKPVVLVVDDMETNVMLLEEILKEEFDVQSKMSGAEAISWLESNPCELVLLDYRMPEMNGLEVLQRIKTDGKLKNVPVILLTADMDMEAEGFKAGAADFIHKPFTPEAVLLRAKRILNYEYLQSKLAEEVRRQTKIAEARRASMQRLFEQTVFALAQAVDAKDKYTHGHSRRVAQYSRTIARIAGDSEEAQLRIYYMALLHDVGKIGIPDEIINKPAWLTDEEYSTIKSHTWIGSDILKCIEEFPDFSKGARHHHERYDGGGYPDGLKGEDIPRMARMIAVADAYDAMTSNRSYRGALSQEHVREEVVRGRGTQFDPQFADIMLRMIDADKNFTMRET